ncbi:MAG: hypothetical protein KA984_02000 [Candidatus Cloacimonetes bacterium]|nr:hypothetical protein [Candidatus Cloacimonadota bacterium]
MGTQQILLIVLSVIIVGVAIAVGISMFNNQAYNSNKTAIASDAQSFAAQVVQYYKTPVSQGGGSGTLPTADAAGAGILGNFIGWGGTTTTNENGTYTVAITTDGASGVATITGVGTAVKDTKHPKFVATITFPAGTIVGVASDV